MDDDNILSSFVEFKDSLDGSLDIILDVPEIYREELLFNMDRHLIKINFKKMLIESNSEDPVVQTWLRFARNYIRNNDHKIQRKQIPLFEVFKTLIDHYITLKSGIQPPVKNPFIPNPPQNPPAFQLPQGFGYQMPQLNRGPDPQILEFIASEHFIFTQANEAKRLLDQLIANVPEIQYGINIIPKPQIMQIHIEIDPSFLDIGDREMQMLGLSFEDPILIKVVVDIYQLEKTSHFTRWSKESISLLTFEASQNNITNTYGCAVYIRELIKIFMQDIVDRISKTLHARHLDTLIKMGYDQNAAQNALATSSDDIDFAIEYLNYGSIRPSNGIVEPHLASTSNLFYNLMFFLWDRLENCTNYCMQCCRRHKYDSIKLVPCENDFCEHRYEQVEGFSVLAELKNKIDVAHLELAFAAKAAFSGRSTNVFEPFPSFMLKSNQVRGRAGFLDAHRVRYDRSMDANKDLQGVINIFNRLPHPDTLLKSCQDELSLRAYLTNLSLSNPKDDNIYRLMRYILATNHVSILPLPSNSKIQGLPSQCTQYIIASNSPETEAYFSKQKAKYGSFFAFHGSAIENWYSILRNGIRNLSNTHMMTAGAAYGIGVYAAEDMATSLGYSKHDTNVDWQHSILCNPPMKCMAIIEIINQQNYIKSPNHVYVVSNDRDLIIRYLIVFPANIQNASIHARNLGLNQHFAQFTQSLKNQVAQNKQNRIQTAIQRAKKRIEESRDNPQQPNIGVQIPYPQAFMNPDPFEDYRIPDLFGFPIIDDGQQFPIYEEAKLETPEYLRRHLEAEEIMQIPLNQFYNQEGLINCLERRHQIELNKLMRADSISVASVDLKSDRSIYVWHVSVNAFSFIGCENLQEDFIRYQQATGLPQYITFEVRSNFYPKEPPFIRVISPRLISRGLIVPEGGILMEVLSPKTWECSTSIVDILTHLIFNLDNKLRIDFQNLNKPYILRDSIHDFAKNARSMNYI
jgi:hypothetical protein